LEIHSEQPVSDAGNVLQLAVILQDQ